VQEMYPPKLDHFWAAGHCREFRCPVVHWDLMILFEVTPGVKESGLTYSRLDAEREEASASEHKEMRAMRCHNRLPVGINESVMRTCNSKWFSRCSVLVQSKDEKPILKVQKESDYSRGVYDQFQHGDYSQLPRRL
jgi:hypothetical protein